VGVEQSALGTVEAAYFSCVDEGDSIDGLVLLLSHAVGAKHILVRGVNDVMAGTGCVEEQQLHHEVDDDGSEVNVPVVSQLQCGGLEAGPVAAQRHGDTKGDIGDDIEHHSAHEVSAQRAWLSEVLAQPSDCMGHWRSVAGKKGNWMCR